MLTLLKIAVALFLQYYPTAYVFTDAKPLASMRDLGAVGVNVLYAENGQYVPHCIASNINHYVVWLDPQRPPMYSVYSGELWGMFTEERLKQVEC